MEDLKYQIKRFIDNKEKVLLIPHKDKHNVLYEWTKIRSPAKVFLNYITIKICKCLPLKAKVFLLRNIVGVNIGKEVGIAPDVDLDVLYPELISFEDGVIVGWKVNILCHEFTDENIRLGRVQLGKKCLIGAFSSIRSGVKIGEHSVIAMNSFVNKDIPPYEMWGGVPAKYIKKIKK